MQQFVALAFNAEEAQIAVADMRLGRIAVIIGACAFLATYLYIILNANAWITLSIGWLPASFLFWVIAKITSFLTRLFFLPPL